MVSRENIRAVTFDVGGTLIECRPSVGHIYAEVASRHGYPLISPAVLNTNFKNAWSRLKEFRHTRAQWSELVDQTFAGLIEPLPSRTFFAELFDRFSEPDAWHIFEDVFPALEALRARGLRLGIISNWDERLRPLLRKLNLDGCFQAITVSCELNVPKPDRRVFEQACQALSCAPFETLHVGDSYEMDVQGAKAAGLQARWLRREHPAAGAGSIQSLVELNKI